jgi:type I restriction enzyme M protein
LRERIKLTNPKTFHSIIRDLSAVSFYDCSLDSKGAAFEYFVRATLKGKKLGQYFTPRELVRFMYSLVGRKKILNSLISGSPLKVLDPACGTGGFLVFLMQDSINQLQAKLRNREITKAMFDKAVKRAKEEIFYGSDANEGVAASAKMNMIIAGDGHTNIQHEDSLSSNAANWSISNPDCHLILTNPPFGTSESDSLSSQDRQQFDIASTKGQHLFIQKMIQTTVSGGEICTVIDEGVLNTESGAKLRKYILTHCKLIAVVSLPSDTFKPNKINVRSSLLYLEKRENPDHDLIDPYNVVFCKIKSLGYYGSGEKVRGFQTEKLLEEIEEKLLNQSASGFRSGYNWDAFNLAIGNLCKDKTYRLDYKYWDLSITNRIEENINSGNPRVESLNILQTARGRSPSPDCYVDEQDGYALVVKAGSSISKFGKIIVDDSDWIEKSVYEEFLEKSKSKISGSNIIEKGDVLLSSTGDGTLGKCAVFDLDMPAIADGHVTIIRVDPSFVNPYYLADYLRNGFGALQISRLYTGSTGMIELTPDQVNSIVVDLLGGIETQKAASNELRKIESSYEEKTKEASQLLEESKNFLSLSRGSGTSYITPS